MDADWTWSTTDTAHLRLQLGTSALQRKTENDELDDRSANIPDQNNEIFETKETMELTKMSEVTSEVMWWLRCNSLPKVVIVDSDNTWWSWFGLTCDTPNSHLQA